MLIVRYRAYLVNTRKYLTKYGVGGVVGATPWKRQVVLLYKVNDKKYCILISVFIPIHHSFGFFEIFLEGDLETPKTPWICPCLQLNQTIGLVGKKYIAAIFI